MYYSYSTLMSKFESIKKEIERIIEEGNPSDNAHSKTTCKWLLRIKPDADEAMQIAALAHDIDRAIPERRLKEELWEQNYATYKEFKDDHAANSAQIIGEVLEKFDFDKEAIDRVKYLVANHERGGDEDANAIRDADSLAFFEQTISRFVEIYGLEKLEAKVRFMYDRMSDKAKELVKQMKFKEEFQKIIDKVIR